MNDEILTEDEVIRFLKLESRAPKKLLYRLRQKGQLKAVRVGKEVKYRRADVLAFVQAQADPAEI